MEKKVDLKILDEKISFEFAGENIVVNPIIGIEQMSAIREDYLKYVFSEDGSFDEPLGEFMFRINIIMLQTNIDLSNRQKSEELDQIVWGRLFDEIAGKIKNYSSMRMLLSLSLQNEIEKRKIENSISGLISKLLPKVNEFLDKFSPEEIERMKGESSSLLKEMRESPIAEILKDSSKEKKSRKKKEYVN